jgi:hypothetical protein
VGEVGGEAGGVGGVDEGAGKVCEGRVGAGGYGRDDGVDGWWEGEGKGGAEDRGDEWPGVSVRRLMAEVEWVILTASGVVPFQRGRRRSGCLLAILELLGRLGAVFGCMMACT